MAATGASLREKAARRISPLFFLAAIGAFLLAFAGVSCNTDTARTLLGSGGQAFGATAAQAQEAQACLDALTGYNLATYSGADLAFGAAPTVASSAPAACAQGDSGLRPAAGGADQWKVGMQRLELIGLIVAAVGALLSIVFFVRSPRARVRSLLTAVVAAAGIALVVFAKLQADKAITDRIAANSAGATPRNVPFAINVADYINVNPGPGFWMAVSALGVTLLLNLAAALRPHSRPARVGAIGPAPGASRSDTVESMQEQPATGPGVTPEERPDVERQQPQPGAEPQAPVPPLQPGPWPGAPNPSGDPPGAPEPPAPHVPG